MSAAASGAGLALRVASSQGASTVELRGELDGYSAERLRHCLQELTDAGHRRIVLDVKEMEFIDSAGLGVLIAATKCLSQHEGELVVTSAGPQAAKLFEMTGVDTVVTVEREP